MNTRPTTATGLAARRTALRMLDACLRTGQPLDQAASAMAKGLEPSDRALAIAIAQEVLRWLPDLDLLIDSQTRLPLAGRWVLRGTDLRLSSERPDTWDSRFVTLAFDVADSAVQPDQNASSLSSNARSANHSAASTAMAAEPPTNTPRW